MSLAYLVDTDWIIDHFNQVEPITRKLEELRPAGLEPIPKLEWGVGAALCGRPIREPAERLPYSFGIGS
ncbi:MAG: hypothetical protein HY347_10105 [candidate division NC10 bacterium]|nr:hypothetical protein [candidate division NC10 bacterium]